MLWWIQGGRGGGSPNTAILHVFPLTIFIHGSYVLDPKDQDSSPHNFYIELPLHLQ